MIPSPRHAGASADAAHPSIGKPLGFLKKGTYDEFLWQVRNGVRNRAVDPHLEVKVGAEAVARAVADPDYLALLDVLAERDGEALLVGVAGGDAAAVIDAGVVAVATAGGLRLFENHGPVGGRADRGAGGDGYGDAGIVPVAAVDGPGPEGRDDRPVLRPDEALGALALDRPGREHGRARGRARGLLRGGDLGCDLVLKLGDVALELLL